MSKFAHVPWCVGIQMAGVALLWAAGFFAPAAFWIAGLAGFLVLFSREVTQAEYRFIEAHGGLRANMPQFAGFRVADWNRHSKDETIWSGVAVIAVAVAAEILWRVI